MGAPAQTRTSGRSHRPPDHSPDRPKSPPATGTRASPRHSQYPHRDRRRPRTHRRGRVSTNLPEKRTGKPPRRPSAGSQDLVPSPVVSGVPRPGLSRSSVRGTPRAPKRQRRTSLGDFLVGVSPEFCLPPSCRRWGVRAKSLRVDGRGSPWAGLWGTATDCDAGTHLTKGACPDRICSPRREDTRTGNRAPCSHRT